VLTPAQFDQWNKLRAEARAKVQTASKPATPPPAELPKK